MNTLAIISIILGLLSTIKIYKDSKQRGEYFDPFESGFLTWLFFWLGLCSIVYYIVKYLP